MSDEADGNTAQESVAETAAQALNVNSIVDERGVPLGNVLKEVTRKLGRISEISSKLDMLLQNNVSANVSPDKGAFVATSDVIDSDTKRYIDARLMEDKRAQIEKAQKVVLDTVFKTFPELDKSSDDYDAEFFNLAVEYEKNINELDPDRPMKAAKLAALDLGKVEKITKAKVLQDDARRSRILSEGSAPSKETKKSQPKGNMNNAAISRFLKVDPKKVEKYAKGE